ncbi:MAG: CYTH domain-containing protein [candidate division Zixibacteria bacterium]|nr:CYTH domain-containing protein [candidate division Zixibacteria bacterium]
MQNEIEIKLNLLDKNNYNKLLKQFKDNLKEIRQENYFFDTKDWDLSLAGWTLRIRKENLSTSITAKGANTATQNGLAIRPEITSLLSPTEAERLFNDGITISSLPRSIIDALPNCPREKPLIKRVYFLNHRIIAGDIINGIPLCFEIDNMEYSDGSLEYELEVELSDKKDYLEVMAGIESIFKACGIPVVFQKESKFARALRKGGLKGKGNL